MRTPVIPFAFNRFLRAFDLDRAVLYGVGGRIWGLVSGLVSVVLIATKFTPELQGYYYTFATLIALQIFVEMGLGTVIIQFSSHEWSELSLDQSGYIVGDSDALSRLRSIASLAVTWFITGALIIIFVLGIAGYFFFSGSSGHGITWAGPWVAVCMITGLNMCLTPVWAILEGCNQVVNLYKFRLLQNICVSLTVWIAILSGADLWTSSISGLVAVFLAGYFLLGEYSSFLKSLIVKKSDTGPKICWREEMLPMQWRIALSWISGYLAFSLFTPVLFKFQGPEVAGQMGMTWSLVSVVGIASSWLAPKVPRFGMLIAQQRYVELDKLFMKTTKLVIGIAVAAAVCLFALVWLINQMGFFLAPRLLSPLDVSLFLIAQTLMVSTMPFSAYLRAHKKEPLMLLSIISGVMIAACTVILGKYYSTTGIATGYLGVHLIVVPLIIAIWFRLRSKWHSEVDPENGTVG